MWRYWWEVGRPLPWACLLCVDYYEHQQPIGLHGGPASLLHSQAHAGGTAGGGGCGPGKSPAALPRSLIAPASLPCRLALPGVPNRALMQFQSEEEARRAKAEADLPPLPPLLAQILAETRAKQQAAKEGREYVPERKAGSDGNASDGEGQPPSGPLLLEGPSSGLVMQGTNVPDRQPGDSDSDSDAEPEAPLGPLDPARCRVHGPGFSGGAAGQPVKLTLTARDTNGKRIREGGAHVLVMVEPPRAPGAQEEPDAIEAEVTDHGDGTYTVVYTVPAKGNYQVCPACLAGGATVMPAMRCSACTSWGAHNARHSRHCKPCCRRALHGAELRPSLAPLAHAAADPRPLLPPPLQLHIEVDGEPVGDSPYPVFFSAAKLVTESGAGPAGGVAAAPGQPAAVAQPGQAQLPAPVTTAGGFQVGWRTWGRRCTGSSSCAAGCTCSGRPT